MKGVQKFCKLCKHHSQAKKDQKFVKIKKVKGEKIHPDPILFKKCLNPLIDGVNRQTHDKHTAVLVMSKAKHPIYTTRTFSCRLWEQD